MSSPQLENGYLKIANELFDALVRYRIPGEQMQCLLFIIRKTYGFGKKSDRISNSQFVEFTGLRSPNVCRAIKNLVSKNIVIKKDNRKIVSYQINKHYNTWQLLSKKITTQKTAVVIKSDSEIIKKDNDLLSKAIDTKDSKDNIQKKKPEDLKIQKSIINLADELYQSKIFPKVNAWVNQKLKEQMNKKAILHVLFQCQILKPDNPWPYCEKIIQVENGNFNEADHRNSYKPDKR